MHEKVSCVCGVWKVTEKSSVLPAWLCEFNTSISCFLLKEEAIHSTAPVTRNTCCSKVFKLIVNHFFNCRLSRVFTIFGAVLMTMTVTSECQRLTLTARYGQIWSTSEDREQKPQGNNRHCMTHIATGAISHPETPPRHTQNGPLWQLTHSIIHYSDWLSHGDADHECDHWKSDV